jgi:hypothetical protein
MVVAEGTSEIAGQVIGPTGVEAPGGVVVHLAREEIVALRSPAAWRCCPSCPYELLDEQCDHAPQAIAQMIAFGMSEVPADREVVTGALGRFRFSRLAKGRYAIWTTAPKGTLALARNISLGDAEKREVKLESEFRASLSGTVLATADGHPIAHAVVAAIDTRLGTSFEAETDEGGGFTIDDLDRRESYYVLASARGMAATGKASVSPGDDTVLELDEAAALIGTVLKDSLPVQGAKVEVDDYLRPLETDGEGHFRFEALSPGIHVVRVSAGDRWGRRLAFELQRGLVLNLSVELVPVSTLKVIVEDSSSQPIGGADVRLLARNSIDHRAAKTDESGVVRFELLTVGKYDLDASRPDRGKISTPIELGKDSTEVTEKLIIRDGAGLHGRITDEQGKPVVHVEVNLEHVDAQADEGEETTRSTKTDDDGRYQIPSLAAGTWQLTASKDGYVDATDAFEMKKSEIELKLVLPKGGTIEGRLVDPSGRPAAGWLVSAMIPGFDPVGEDTGPGNFSFGQRRYSNADGTFAFTGLGQKDYELFAEPPSPDEKSVDTASTRTEIVRAKAGDAKVVVKTRGMGELSGTVAFVGAPAPESFTTSIPANGTRSFDGGTAHFHFASAIAGSYPIVLRAPHFVPVTMKVAVPLGGAAQIEAVMHASARIRGRVVDARDGSPIAEATIAAWSDARSADAGDRPASATITRRDGYFELTDLSPGQQFVIAHADGYGRKKSGPFQVASNKELPALEIRLDRASVRMSGRIIAGGRPLSNALLSLRDPNTPNTPPVNAHADGRGRFAFNAIEPGLFCLGVAGRGRGTGKETAIMQRLVTVPSTGLDGYDVDLDDHGGDRRVVVELSGKRRSPILITLRAGTIDQKKIDDLTAHRLDAADARAAEPNQREVAFDRVAPGSYTITASRIEPDDNSVQGYADAPSTPLALEHIIVKEADKETRLVIRGE